MARFKKFRRFARRSGKAYRRSSRKSGTGSMVTRVLTAAAYGAVRNKVSEMAQPLTSKIPLGQYADEVVFGVAGYLMAKKGSGMVRDAGLAILTVEAASIGHQAMSGMTGSSSSGGW